METGVVYITLKLELNMDIELKAIKKFVNDLDIKIKDPTNNFAEYKIADFC